MLSSSTSSMCHGSYNQSTFIIYSWFEKAIFQAQSTSSISTSSLNMFLSTKSNYYLYLLLQMNVNFVLKIISSNCWGDLVARIRMMVKFSVVFFLSMKFQQNYIIIYEENTLKIALHTQWIVIFRYFNTSV